MNWEKTYLKGNIVPGRGFYIGVHGTTVAVFKRFVRPEEEGRFGVSGVRVDGILRMLHCKSKDIALSMFRSFRRAYISGVKYILDGHGPVFVIYRFREDRAWASYRGYWCDHESVEIYGSDLKILAMGPAGYNWHDKPAIHIGNKMRSLEIAEENRVFRSGYGYNSGTPIRSEKYSWPNTSGIILGAK